VPDVASSGQHLADLAAGLVKRGHQVTVVTSRRAYAEPRVRFPAEETWRGVRVLRVGVFSFGRGAIWRRILDALSFAVFSCLRICRLPRPDVIVALTSPPLISVVGLWLARLRRCQFVCWVMDLNPDEAVAAGCLRADSPLGICLEWLSRMTLRNANRVVVLDRFMFSRIAAKGVPSSRITVVPPWSQDSEVHFDVKGRERFRRQHGLEGKFVVMYSGNHSLCHPLDTVLDAARMLAGNREVVFCFIGGGAQFHNIERMAGRHKSKSVCDPDARIRCLPYQPLSRLSDSLSAADLHLVVMGEPFVGIVHPCKIYNILKLATPILYVGPKPSPVSEILGEEIGDCLSACVSHGDAAGLVREIRRVLNRSPRRSTARRSRSYARFSRKSVLPRLIAQLEQQDGVTE